MIVFFNFLLQLSSGKNKAYLEVLSFAILISVRVILLIRTFCLSYLKLIELHSSECLKYEKNNGLIACCYQMLLPTENTIVSFFFALFIFLNYSKIKLQSRQSS